MHTNPSTAHHSRRRSATTATKPHTGTMNKFAGRTITIAPHTKPPTTHAQPGNRPPQPAIAPAKTNVPIDNDKLSVK